MAEVEISLWADKSDPLNQGAKVVIHDGPNKYLIEFQIPVLPDDGKPLAAAIAEAFRLGQESVKGK